MKIAKQRYRRVPVDELLPHPRNPRRGDVAAIRESIQHNDFVGAILVQRSTGYVIAGRHRLTAAVEEGATDVPVLEVDVDDETALRILLADNRTSDRAGYDEPGLLELLREIGAGDGTLEGTGWSFEDFRALEAEAALLGAGPLETAEGQGKLDQREPGSVELAFGGERLALFRKYAKVLGAEWETSELSDTVFECLERAVQNLPS